MIVAAFVWSVRRTPQWEDSHVYRVGVDHAPPYNLLEPGKPVRGLAVDVITEAARRKGIRLEFIPLDIAVDDAFRRGIVDLWPAATDTPERRGWLHVSKPYLANHLSIVSRGEQPAYRLEDLLGRRIGVARSRIVKEILGRVAPEGYEAVEVASRRESLVALCEGRVQASIIEQRYLEQSLLSRPAECTGVSFQVLNAVGADRMLAIISSRQASHVADALRDAISDMISDGTFTVMMERWSAFSGSELRTALELEEAEKRGSTVLMGLLAALMAAALLIWQNRRLAHARAAADSATRAKSDFLASMSHEIRTPLNGILGMTQLLQATHLDKEQHDTVEVIHQSGEHLLKVINDILDFSKVEAGKLELDSISFDVQSLARQVTAIIKPDADAKGLKIELVLQGKPAPMLLGDPHRVRQVLLNLLGNAVKFTDTGSVRFSVETAKARSGWLTVRFIIADTGIGIPKAKLGLLFEKFSQLDSSRTRRHGGTGLGLAVCRELVQLMQGSIQVESEEGSGSCFTVELPFAVAPIPKLDAGESALSNFQVLQGMRVLLVEDNPINERVALKLLERCGCEVSIARNGAEAVSHLARHPVDLVLMDCFMPEMDGCEATRRIRALNGDAARVPIIAMTAGVHEDDRLRCEEAGMDGFFSKPFELEALVALLEQYRVSPPRA